MVLIEKDIIILIEVYWEKYMKSNQDCIPHAHPFWMLIE
jgi:hypothetical protein